MSSTLLRIRNFLFLLKWNLLSYSSPLLIKFHSLDERLSSAEMGEFLLQKLKTAFSLLPNSSLFRSHSFLSFTWCIWHLLYSFHFVKFAWFHKGYWWFTQIYVIHKWDNMSFEVWWHQWFDEHALYSCFEIQVNRWGQQRVWSPEPGP